jgi:hypothetical protein
LAETTHYPFEMAAPDMAASNLARGDGLIEPPTADIFQLTPNLSSLKPSFLRSSFSVAKVVQATL